MKIIRGIFNLENKKVRKLGLLLISTIVIIIASSLAYARVIFEKALNVGNASGVLEGSSSTASAGISLTLAIVVLATPALVTCLIIFIFRRNLSIRISDTPVRPELSPTDLASASFGIEETEDSPKKEESEVTDDEILRAILDSREPESGPAAQTTTP